jgi:serine-type D-Ala-D-Ala carboxypeptidase/endopeptidase
VTGPANGGIKMKTFGRIAIATVTAIATLLSSSQIVPRAAAQTGCGYDFSEVTALIQNAVDTVPLTGASLMLMKDDQVIYEQYFGSYNAGTTVRIASASKWLAGATLMTLVDEKKLSLDDKASQYLPYFTGEKGAITIRQMFSHTSGLPAIMDDAPCLAIRNMPMDECVQRIAQSDLIGPPGEQFAYGENSMQVAGRICEIVSGKSWEFLFQEKIATPLGMNGTTFGDGGNPFVGGGARSRLRDYANFLQMILNKGKLNGWRALSVKSVREMQQNLTAGLPAVFAPPGVEEANYGIGEWLDILDKHGRAVQVSSPGALGFTPWVDKERNLLGVFLVEFPRQRIVSTIAMVQQKVREAVEACEGR